MKINKINLYWFSGTGNTKIIVDNFVKAITQKGVEVSLWNIEDTKPEDVDITAVVGLAFPVAVSGTYPFVWDFISNLPKSDGIDIFMIDTLGMFSGGIVGPTKKVIKSKGYNPIGAIEVIMPSNYFVKKIDEEKNRKKIKKSIAKINQFADNLYNNKTTWSRIPIFSDILSILPKSKNVWQGVKKTHKFSVNKDKDKCTGCEICVKICPVNNLFINKNGIAEYKDECIICMRCTSFCPVEAIGIKNKNYINYHSVKVNELNK